MTSCPGPGTEKMNWLWFAAGLTFAATVAVVNWQSWPVRPWMILSVGLLLIALRFRSLARASDKLQELKELSPATPNSAESWPARHW